MIGRARAQSTGLGGQVGALHVPWSGPAAPSPPSRRGFGSLMLCSGRGPARLSIQEECGAPGRIETTTPKRHCGRGASCRPMKEKGGLALGLQPREPEQRAPIYCLRKQGSRGMLG